MTTTRYSSTWYGLNQSISSWMDRKWTPSLLVIPIPRFNSLRFFLCEYPLQKINLAATLFIPKLSVEIRWTKLQDFRQCSRIGWLSVGISSRISLIFPSVWAVDGRPERDWSSIHKLPSFSRKTHAYVWIFPILSSLWSAFNIKTISAALLPSRKQNFRLARCLLKLTIIKNKKERKTTLPKLTNYRRWDQARSTIQVALN